MADLSNMSRGNVCTAIKQPIQMSTGHYIQVQQPDGPQKICTFCLSPKPGDSPSNCKRYASLFFSSQAVAISICMFLYLTKGKYYFFLVTQLKIVKISSPEKQFTSVEDFLFCSLFFKEHCMYIFRPHVKTEGLTANIFDFPSSSDLQLWGTQQAPPSRLSD